MTDRYYLEMILEQLNKNLVYTAYVNINMLIKDTKDKKLEFKLIPIREELIDLINKKGNTNNYGKELKVIKEDVKDILRRF